MNIETSIYLCMNSALVCVFDCDMILQFDVFDVHPMFES